MKYLSVTQTAEKWGISQRRIQTLCNEERIEGAVRIGHSWAIPDGALSRLTQESKAESISNKLWRNDKQNLLLKFL